MVAAVSEYGTVSCADASPGPCLQPSFSYVGVFQSVLVLSLVMFVGVDIVRRWRASTRSEIVLSVVLLCGVILSGLSFDMKVWQTHSLFCL